MRVNRRVKRREYNYKFERERESGKGLLSSVGLFGFAATHTTPKGERGGSFLPALGFGSFI
jgi:hypothetical protein